MKPVGKRVLVQELEPSETTEAGIILAPSARKELIAEGIVLEIPEDLPDDEKIPVAKGDKLLYNRNTAVTVDQTQSIFTVQFDSILVKY